MPEVVFPKAQHRDKACARAQRHFDKALAVRQLERHVPRGRVEGLVGSPNDYGDGAAGLWVLQVVLAHLTVHAAKAAPQVELPGKGQLRDHIEDL